MTSSPPHGPGSFEFLVKQQGQQKTDDKLEHDAHNRVEKSVSKGIPEIRIPQHLHIIFKTVEFYSACVKAPDGHALKTDDPVIEDGKPMRAIINRNAGREKKYPARFFRVILI